MNEMKNKVVIEFLSEDMIKAGFKEGDYGTIVSTIDNFTTVLFEFTESEEKEYEIESKYLDFSNIVKEPMQEIIVTVEQTPGIIQTNFKEVKNQLYLQMDAYRNLTYTVDTVKSAKEDIAMLNKIRKAIEDKRKEIKKAQMLTYDEYAKMSDELIEIIDDVINPIKEQTSVFESKRKKERLVGIKSYFVEKVTGFEKYITFENVFTDSMLNSSTTAKSIKETFDAAIESVKKDVETIQSMKSEIEVKVLDKYSETKSLSNCINMITEHEKMKAEILAKQEQEQKVAEEKRIAEEKMRAEIEEKMRAEAEERKLQEAVEKAKEEERRKVEQEVAIQRAKEEKERQAKEEVIRIECEKQAELLRIEMEKQAELDRIEAERIEKERIEKEIAEKLEAERLAKIAEDERLAEEKRILEEKKKNAKYFLKITDLKKEQLNVLAEYLKANEYHFESGLE